MEDRSIVYNLRYSRQLEFYSSWIYFEYIEDLVKANHIAELKKKDHLLCSLIKMIYAQYKAKHNGIEPFKMPANSDAAGLLAIACKSNPKLRGLLRIWGELVVLGRQKSNIWCSFPGTQILLEGCARVLEIPSACYTAELNKDERDNLVRKFTTDSNDCFLFIGSFYVGSIRLNLQKLSHHIIDYDAPPNRGLRDQTQGRNSSYGWTLTRPPKRCSAPMKSIWDIYDGDLGLL
jgi:SNF2 family DNA or RNA helicase